MATERSAPRSAVPALLLLLGLTSMTTSLYNLPLNRVIEMRLCRDHYLKTDPSLVGLGGNVDEKYCKIDSIQSKLAWLLGIMETTQTICDLVVTLPLGYLCHRIGRRKVLWLNLIPRITLLIWAILVGRLNALLPTEAILAGPFLAVLGGECVFQSVILTITSSLSHDYVRRASYFAYTSSTTYVVAFIGPSVAAMTMSLSLWLPFWIGLVLLALAAIAISYIPDKSEADVRSRVRRLSNDSETSTLLGEGTSDPSHYSGIPKIVKFTLAEISHGVQAVIRLISGRRHFQILLVSFILTAIASSDTKLLAQYISKRYKWTFAEAGYLLSAKASVNIVLLVVIVPWAVRMSRSYSQLSEWALNISGAKLSLIVSVIGVLCIALSARFWLLMCSLIIYALGSALPVFTMSLVKLCERNDNGNERDVEDFSIVVIIKTIGSLIGAPLMTVTWVKAINIGGKGLGLPYFISACFYVIAFGTISRLGRTSSLGM